MHASTLAASFAAATVLGWSTGHAIDPVSPWTPPGTTIAASPAHVDRTLPDPIGPLRIPENAVEELSLLDILKEFGRLTNQQLVLNDQARASLQSTPIGVVQGGFDVPAPDVYAFVEGLLFHNGYYLSVVNSGEFPIMSIDGNQGRNSAAALHWVEVDSARIQEYANHSSLLVATTVNTLPMDSRQLATTLRGILTDTQRQTILPVGDASLLLRGTGRQVADVASLIERARKTAAENQPEPEPEPAGGGGK